MAYIIGVVSQKGGVGKSTVARLVATDFARMDGGTWDVKIADLDISQATSFHWMQRRHANATQPEIRVEGYQRLEKATNDAEHFDVMVLDGAPHATTETLRIARVANLVIIPTGTHPDRHSTGRPGTICAARARATQGWRRSETDGAGADSNRGQ